MTLAAAPANRTTRSLHPWHIVGRLCTCTSCGHHVDLIEIPEPWIDADTYVCGTCLQPVEAAAAVSAQNRDGIPY